MSVHVNFEVDLLLESFTTTGADEGPEAGVSAHVRVQVGCSIEGFLADDAHVWFHRRVRQTMTCEVARLAKST